jgi:hypothetical protein
MARKGRPSKTGKRNRSGRLKPVPSPHDKGTERVQSLKERFGEHYSTAIGRAFVAGLLGAGQVATDRYDAGKRFARVYARVIHVRGYRCPLNDSPRGGNPDLAMFDQDKHDHDLAEQRWLFDMMDRLNKAGLRPWLDQLISDQYTDRDPSWLAVLISGHRHPADLMILGCANKALDILAPPRRVVSIAA